MTVAADFDWSSIETTREIFEPAAEGVPLARSRQTITETFSGAGVTPPGGVPGVASNTPPTGDDATGDATESSQYSRTEVTENNELTKRIERNVQAPGRLTSMRVSVLLDTGVAEPDVAAITDAVRNMVDETRGDSVSVGIATFSTEIQDQAEAALTEAASAAQMSNMITIGVVVVVILAVVVFLWRTLRAIRRGIVPVSVDRFGARRGRLPARARCLAARAQHRLRR